MKHLLLLLCSITVFSFSSKAQYVPIPDAFFRDFLMNKYPASFNAAHEMDTSSAAIVNATSIKTPGNITNWEGFQYFKNLDTAEFTNIINILPPAFPPTLKVLITGVMGTGGAASVMPALPNGLTHLTCQSTHIASLPALPNSLIYLNCQRNYSMICPASLPPALETFIWGFNAAPSWPALPSTLTIFNCAHNYLTSLPALPAGLLELNCDSNHLSSFPVLPAGLQKLSFYRNYFTALPALPAGLKSLSCGFNQIQVLPVLPSQLEEFNTSYNGMTSITAPLPSTLKTFSVRYNELTALPPLPAGLTHLDYYDNNIPVAPPLPTGLKHWYCGANQVEQLPVALPPTLEWLECENNFITVLPKLPASLRQMSCAQNRLTQLPPLPDSLYIIDVSYNLLNSLPKFPKFGWWGDQPGNTIRSFIIVAQHNNFNCIPVVPADSSYYIGVYMDDEVVCIPNKPPGRLMLQLHNDMGSYYATVGYNDTYPLCNPLNNEYQCKAFPLMTGHVFVDNNSNAIKDIDEPYRSNVKTFLQNGTICFSDTSGYFQLPATDTGYYTSNIVRPDFFTSAPLQYDYHFYNYDTLVVGDYALQPTAIADSADIRITPLRNRAVPGFVHHYQIDYQNDGTTNLNANLVIEYDNTRLTYDSSSNPAVIHTGNTLTLNEPNFIAGQQKNFLLYFRTMVNAFVGDSVKTYGHITANSFANHDTNTVPVRASMDPNDKTGTPTLSRAQVMRGDYIYYTVRFQNTGNDTAVNIVLGDLLSTKLQPGTLEMLSSSHSCRVMVAGNMSTFEFLNINLPDSNVNEIKSHGFVTFRIKPKSNLLNNSLISNKASIYFDYNSPVITNTFITTVFDPSVVPLNLLSFTATKTGSNAMLLWRTSNEVNVKQYNIEMSVDGRNFTTLAIENAKGFINNIYTKTVAMPANPVIYFRLKMIDISGIYSYSNIVTLRNDRLGQPFSFGKNPVSDLLTIQVQDDALKNTSATIYNAQGLAVKTFLLKNDVVTIDIKSLAAGVYYFVTIKGNKQFIIVR